MSKLVTVQLELRVPGSWSAGEISAALKLDGVELMRIQVWYTGQYKQIPLSKDTLGMAAHSGNEWNQG